MNVYKNGKFVSMTDDEIKDLEQQAQELAVDSLEELSDNELQTRVEQLEQAINELKEENTALKLAQGLATVSTIKNINSIAKAVSEGG
jgi:small-conductance mechanosensitive channel